jgi:serine O-acetyltransferase
MQFNSKKDYRNLLEADLKASNITPSLKNKLTHDVWAFQKCLRKLGYYINYKHPPLTKVYTIFMRLKLRSRGRKLGLSVPPNEFGPGLSIAHVGTIVVNSNAIIGSNCRYMFA